MNHREYILNKIMYR